MMDLLQVQSMGDAPLTPTAFKDAVLTLGVLEELKRQRLPVTLITVKRPDQKASPAAVVDDMIQIIRPCGNRILVRDGD